ncbi:Mercuric ion reductase [hydrothermal vent metagenome]|uniref:Mercuric reductase n=1 Tax=hydrothermal vent metagenome TaxID=652676 RepID=A0A3B0XA00_9ZZZZ
MNKAKLQVVIIGTGSGAFAAAIKAVEKGALVTIIEGADIIGGTCVNVGCVPSKIMIRAGHIAHIQNQHNFAGLPFNQPVIDRKAMVQQQQKMVEKLRYAKYESILESNPDINLIRGMARFKDTNTVLVTQKNGDEKEIKADRILLAVGARAMIPDISGLNKTPYWTSTEALIAEEIPKHLVVLGGSVVALELAQAFRHLGSEVTVMARSTLLSKDDAEIGKELKSALESEGIKMQLYTVPYSVSHDGEKFTVGTEKDEIECNQLLVATGRRSNSDTLAIENAGVAVAGNGNIIIDDYMRTNVENIYAAGDCSNQPQYVYVAAAAGTRAARNMTGEDVAIDLSAMPAVVFTEPQVATVGLSEQQAKAQGFNVESRQLALENVPRALANMDTRGFIKLVAEKESGKIIGCQVLASEAGEIIQSAALAISNKMTIENLANQLFPYLTMVEGLKLTAQTFNKDVKQLSCCAG